MHENMIVVLIPYPVLPNLEMTALSLKPKPYLAYDATAKEYRSTRVKIKSLMVFEWGTSCKQHWERKNKVTIE